MTEDKFEAIVEWDFTERSGKTVTVRMGPPIFDRERDNWACETEVVGLPRGERAHARGIHPFQAITMAMERFRVIFEQEEGEYKSVSSWPTTPYFTFARYIPTSYGTDVYTRIATLVEGEVQKVEDEWTRRREESDRRRESEGETG